MPVAEISLNGLARRVGLAKSNVLRYFESREAVLLELQDEPWTDWLAGLAADLPTRVDPDAAPAVRADALAAALTDSLERRPLLCELVSASAAVLERNVSTEVAIRHKRAAIAHVGTLAGLVRTALPELAQDAAVRFAAATALTAGALWTHARPCAAVRAAYDVAPELATLRVEFADALREMLATLLAGLLTRTTR